jgi:hypothetical protein
MGKQKPPPRGGQRGLASAAHLRISPQKLNLVAR